LSFFVSAHRLCDMSTPNDERPEPTYGYNADRAGQSDTVDHLHHPPAQLPSYNVNNGPHAGRRSYELNRSSDEEGTLHGDNHEPVNPKSRASGFPRRTDTLLTVDTQYDRNDDIRSQASPSQTREQARRLDDDLELLKIERQISRIEEREEEGGESMHRSRSRRRDEDLDEFDIATNPVHEKTQVYKPVENPSSSFAKFFKTVHKSNWLIRYFTYIAPLSLILLIPLLIGLFLFPNQKVGGVTMWWFMIWLEIVWLTLWLGRIIAKCLPWPIGIVSTLFTNNGKKWRDMGKQLEMPATLFFWGLAIEISFLPTMTSHMPDRPDKSATGWQKSMNKVLISFLVGVALNFVEKILIQLIAISFHLRTYADRIEINKFQIGSLIKLYIFSKTKIAMEDSEFEIAETNNNSGARTPGALISEAAKTTKEVVGKIGDVTGKIAGDFTGKTVYKSTHPNQVVITLLSTISGSQVLARRLYRTFARESTETVYQEDLHNAFENEDEATAAFSMFDKDMNGDISMEELEAVCVEIGRERKSITASLKDLDSVVSKLDDVFMFIVIVVVILVLISLISTSAAGVLTSAGSAVLALSWLFSTTAQEFLQSVVFVFIKHPFDVGDRVGIYGNTGKAGLGDDYFVKEISLLYTEFKKMEGHVVQAPNSYLNTLFILNQRRSGGLAEAVTISIKFGTTLEQIESLRSKLLEFVKAEKREYQGNILTELRDIVDVHSMNLNVVFFYKSNWQNEGLRLARRNKFICALMVCIQELSIEGPYMRFPGQKQSFPMYLQNVPHINNPDMGTGGQPSNPAGFDPNAPQDEPFVNPAGGESGAPTSRMRSGSILRNGSNMRRGGESLSAMNKRVDFSLGMKDCVYGDLSGDMDEDRQKNQMAAIHEATRSRERNAEAERRSQDIGKTTSRDHHHGPRSSMESEASRRRASTHRNRFFNRTRTGTFGPDEASLMEGGMADIPEARSGNQTGNNSPGGHIDARTGLVSSAAYRTTTNESDASYPTRQPMAPRIPTDVLPSSSNRPHGATVEDAPEQFSMPSRSATQDFEPKKYQMPGRSATQDFEMKKLS
jgi:small-conductance mechanosensitive channel